MDITIRAVLVLKEENSSKTKWIIKCHFPSPFNIRGGKTYEEFSLD